MHWQQRLLPERYRWYEGRRSRVLTGKSILRRTQMKWFRLVLVALIALTFAVALPASNAEAARSPTTQRTAGRRHRHHKRHHKGGKKHGQHKRHRHQAASA